MDSVFDKNVERSFFSGANLDKDQFIAEIHKGFSCLATPETHVSRYESSTPPSRLYWVLGYMAAKLESGGQDLIRLHGLFAIHDRKGNLTSVWNRSPSLNEICALTSAWHSVGEENHVILVYPPDGEPYTWDVTELTDAL